MKQQNVDELPNMSNKFAVIFVQKCVHASVNKMGFGCALFFPVESALNIQWDMNNSCENWDGEKWKRAELSSGKC